MEDEKHHTVQPRHVEEREQEGAALEPVITREHHDYLMDRHGTVDLLPVPSMDPKDPYNWSSVKKTTNLLMLAFHAMMTTFTAAAIIPAYEPLAEALGVTLQEASYLTGAQILVLGVAPLFWKPFSHRFGRKPTWLISTLFSGCFNIGCALSTSYGMMMAFRCLVAFFIAPPIAIGTGVVVETFLAKERGRKLGIWTLLVTLGPPSGPFIFGFVTQHAGWIWIYWTLAIINFVQFLAYLFLGSESRYIRTNEPQTHQTVYKKVKLFQRIDQTPITTAEIIDPLVIGRYLNVLIPTVAYTIVFGFASVLITVEIPQTFGEKFGLDAQQLGLNFIAIIVGTVIGEQAAGPLSDTFMTRKTRKLGERPAPEYRLWLSYLGFITAIVGLIVFGVQLENATAGVWNVTPIIGAGIAAFGNQIVTTVLVTYAVDCHPDHGSAVGGFIALVRQTWGFILPFWLPQMFDALNYTGSLGLCAGLIAACGALPILVLQITQKKSRSPVDM